MIRLYLWFCRVLFCCTRTAGAVGTRLSLRPLIFEGRTIRVTLAQTCGEIAKLCLLFSLAPFLRGEGLSLRAVFLERALTRPASLRFAGRPLPARAGRGDSKRFALSCLKIESVTAKP